MPPDVTTIRVDPARTLGAVSPLVYGHFIEHLANIVYDGIWAEMVYGRKFEAPMVSRTAHEPAMPWAAYPGPVAGTALQRAEAPLPRFASPNFAAHHTQGILFTDAHPGSEFGLAQAGFRVEAGVELVFRARLRRAGAAAPLRVALRRADSEAVLAEASIALDDFKSDLPVSPWMNPFGWHEVSVRLTPEASDPAGRLTLTAAPAAGQPAIFWLDWVSLVPAGALDGLDAGVVAALREAPVRLLKWPGGCMADNYDWRWGIGPRDSRYCFMDYAWLGWDENDVGTDEFIRLCRLVDAEPNLCVNAGSSTPEVAAAWVEYCNGDAGTEWGARRAANGNPEPFEVRYWCIGNEQWGFFERGFAGVDDYARRYRRLATAMRAVDPGIKLIATGQPGEFNRALLREAGDLIDMLSIHWYSGEVEPADAAAATAKIRQAAGADAALRDTAADILAAGAPHVTVAFDEWGWARGSHAGAAFAAAVLNAIHRHAPLVGLGGRSCAVNVDGLVSRDGSALHREPVFETFALYNRAHREAGVNCEVHGDAAGSLDASALADASGVSVFAVNTGAEPVRVRLELAGGTPLAGSRVESIVPGEGGSWGPSQLVAWVTGAGGELELAPHAVSVVTTYTAP